MNPKNFIILGGVFYTFFLFLTPLGVFNEWIPPHYSKGFYSILKIDEGDDTGYYAYLRSAFFDLDWDFINEREYIHSEKFISSTGYVFNYWQVGQSILFFPFFLVGHLLALSLNAMGYPLAVDGYSVPYKFATGIASQTYVFIGLVLLFHILKRYFRESSAIIATLGIWLGSPLLYYTFIRQRMAHGTEFFLAVVFLFFWLRVRASQDKYHHALLGALLGLFCLVRVINISYLFFYYADQIWQWHLNHGRKNLEPLKTYGVRIGIFSLFLLFVFSPQIYSWSQLLGSPLAYLMKVMNQAQNGLLPSADSAPLLKKISTFFFVGPWPFIFSSPLWFVGTLGILFFRPVSKDIFPGIIIYLCVLFCLIIVVGHSSAFGIRNIIPAAPLFSFGLAAVIDKIYQRSIFYWSFLVFFVLCIFVQYKMIVLYKVNYMYSDPNFTFKAWSTLGVHFTTNWFNGHEFGLRNLLRPTNFFQLLFLDRSMEWNYRDTLFLVVFPGAQLFSLTLVIGIVVYSNRLFKGVCFSIQPKIATLIVPLAALSFLVLVGLLVPAKSTEEIAGRNQYSRLIKSGLSKVSAHKYEEAIAEISKAASLVPDAWKPYFYLAWIYYKHQSNFKKADEYYQKALNLNNGNAALLSLMGRNLMLLKNFKEAKIKLLSSYQINPLDKYTCEALGQLYVYLNNDEKGRKFFKRSVVIDPGFGEGHSNLAILLLVKMKRIEEGIYHLRKAIELGIREPELIFLSTTYGIPLSR